MKKLILLFGLFRGGHQAGFAQPGILDPRFGINGIVKSDLGRYSNQHYVYGSTFKLLEGNNDSVIYNVVGALGAIYVNKVHKNGSTDANYGINGFSVVAPMDGRDAVMQQDGKILVIGTINRGEGVSDFALARFNTDGTFDTSFSGDGVQATNFGLLKSEAQSVALQADGKILVTGTSGGFMLLRYNQDGSIDNNFSAEGNHTTINAVDIPTSLLIQKDGKIIISGYKLTSPGYGYVSADFALSRYSAQGRLDTTFANAGNQTSPFSNNGYTVASYSNSSVLQKDGKIILAGYVNLVADGDIINVLALARYNINGNPDSTFGTDGKLTTGGTLNFESNPALVTLQDDGKILLAATAIVSSYREFAILRFNQNGSPDKTFSGDGIQTARNTDAETFSGAVSAGKEGKILVGGVITDRVYRSSFALKRYTKYGATDSTFGKNGLLIGNLKQGNTVYKSMAIQKDGKIVTAGYTWNGTKFIFAVSRFYSNGIPDSSFSGDGTKTTSFSDGDDMGNSVAIQEDGKIVVGGSAGKDQHRKFAFARYTMQGEPDSSFSGNGKHQISVTPDGDDYINAITIQTDGSIVAGGVTNSRAVIIRLTSNGYQDNAFGGNGKQVVPQLYSELKAMALQKDGKIVVTGFFGLNNAVLARYTGNGYPDTTFGKNGLVEWNFKYDNFQANALAIQNDGKIVTGSDVLYLDDEYSFALARYTSTGKVDHSFGENGKAVYKDPLAYVNSIAIERDGKIIAAGTRGNHSSVARFTIDGIVDNTFGNNGIQITQISGNTDQVNSIAVDSNALYTAGTCTCPNNLGTVVKYTLGLHNTPVLATRATRDTSHTKVQALNPAGRYIINDQTLKISPNPAAGVLQIDIKVLPVNKKITIMVMSSSGVIIKTLQIAGSFQTIQMDVSSLQPGVYIIKLVSGNKVIYKKFVKMRE